MGDAVTDFEKKRPPVIGIARKRRNAAQGSPAGDGGAFFYRRSPVTSLPLTMVVATRCIRSLKLVGPSL